MNLLRSEWTKLRSLRSTWVLAVSTIFFSAAISAIGAYNVLGKPLSELPDPWDPTATSLKGLLLAQLLIGMLGALSITAEHGTGTIGTSLATVPARSRLLAAKTVVITAIALITALVATLVNFTVVQLMLDGAGIPAAGIADPGVAGALAGGTLYLTLIALLGVAVGVLSRSTAGSLAVLVGAFLFVPGIAPGLPGALGDWFEQYWPITAGQAAYTVIPVDGVVSPWVGAEILAATTAAVSIIGHATLRARDI